MNWNKSDEARRNRMSAIVDSEEEKPAAPAQSKPDPYEGRRQLREACSIRRDRIVADPDQPRAEFEPEALGRLAESLKARGQLQPIRVRWDEGRGVYVVVVGERRWRAAGLAGMESLTCVVVTGTPSPDEILEDQLVENAIREDLKPVEAARAYQRLMTALGLSQQRLADKLKISQATVSQTLALLDLPASVQAGVDDGRIAPSAAYLIAKLPDPDDQAELARRVVDEGLSRSDTMEEVRRRSSKSSAKGKTRKVTSRVFRKMAGCTVTVECAKGLRSGDVEAALVEALERIRSEEGASIQLF